MTVLFKTTRIVSLLQWFPLTNQCRKALFTGPTPKGRRLIEDPKAYQSRLFTQFLNFDQQKLLTFLMNWQNQISPPLNTSS